MIVEGKLNKMLRMLKMQDRVSDTASHLMTAMLHPDPEQRLTLEEVAAHRWLDEDAED